MVVGGLLPYFISILHGYFIKIELYLESLAAHGEEIPTEERTLEYTVTVPAYA
jgi:hypothetical protein